MLYVRQGSTPDAAALCPHRSSCSRPTGSYSPTTPVLTDRSADLTLAGGDKDPTRVRANAAGQVSGSASSRHSPLGRGAWSPLPDCSGPWAIRGDAARRPIWIGFVAAVLAIWLVATVLALARAPAKSRFVPVCPMPLRRGPALRDRVDPGWAPASSDRHVQPSGADRDFAGALCAGPPDGRDGIRSHSLCDGSDHGSPRRGRLDGARWHRRGYFRDLRAPGEPGDDRWGTSLDTVGISQGDWRWKR
jgi:hypothetical protein